MNSILLGSSSNQPNKQKMMRTLHTTSTPQLRICHSSSTLLPPKPKPQFLVNHNFSQAKFLHSTLQISYPNQIHIQSSIPSSSMANSGSTQAEKDTLKNSPFSVLFVCLGNICRSPAAEGVFTDLVKKRGLLSRFRIDSAGTINYHEGGPADSRMRAASKKRGIEITSISRPLKPSDFKEFDLILAMDKQNKEDILTALERWSFKESLAADAHKKVRLMCSYCKRHDETEVPDPYYGGAQGFEKVLDLLEDGCDSLLESILAEDNRISDS